ncbi:MAG: type II toxin-antitoxin system PemK/MazF family toxin, partial [Gammaproteobacteria bacterium]|nr:type II toxin-antitoxin system PemK/MazF family toxin [Gammaproteobacteria bacterium]
TYCARQAAGLLKPSAIKPVLFTAEQRLVRKSLGRPTADDQQALRAMIVRLIG